MIQCCGIHVRSERRAAVDRQHHRGILAAELAGGRLPDAAQSMTEARPPRHHVQVGDLARGQSRRCRDFTGKADRFGAAFEADRRVAPDRQHQAFPADDGKRPVDSGKFGEGAIGGDPCHADAPVKVVERSAGRLGNDLDCRAAAILPWRSAASSGADDLHGRAFLSAGSAGRAGWRAHNRSRGRSRHRRGASRRWLDRSTAHGRCG